MGERRASIRAVASIAGRPASCPHAQRAPAPTSAAGMPSPLPGARVGRRAGGETEDEEGGDGGQLHNTRPVRVAPRGERGGRDTYIRAVRAARRPCSIRFLARRRRAVARRQISTSQLLSTGGEDGTREAASADTGALA
jgi:hypothetical protein